MATSACLVTSTPSFDPPEQTAPFLIAASAAPDPRRVLIFDESKDNEVEFSVDVRSEDNGQRVVFQLYIDYGFSPPDSENQNGRPFRHLVTLIDPLKPGTITDTKRRVQVKWRPQTDSPINAGCHNVTLMAAHDFDLGTGCPKCLSDSSQLTWQVFDCNSARDNDCKPDFSACPSWPRSCPLAAQPDDIAECGVSP